MRPRNLLLNLAVILIVSGSAAAQQSVAPTGRMNPEMGRRDPADEVVESLIESVDPNWIAAKTCWITSKCPEPKYTTWFAADYMLSFLNNSTTPPLITSAPFGQPLGTAAALGQPGTQIVFGNGELNSNPYSGLRLTAGTWLSPDGCYGVEASGFFLLDRSLSGNASGTGAADSIAVGRPFVDVATGKETVAYSAFANQFSGSSSATMTTGLWGAELNGVLREDSLGLFGLQFLGGVRYLDFHQQLDLQDNSTPLGTATVPFAGVLAITNPNIVRVTDYYQTRNQFFGGQLGMRGKVNLRRLELGAGAKVALGGTHQNLTIRGTSEALTSSGQLVVLAPGGLLANASNMGSFSRNDLAIVPELDVKLGYRISNRFTAYLSYNLLIWQNVAMVGPQVNRNVDLRNVPTSAIFNVAPGTVGNANIVHSDLTVSTIMLGGCYKF